VSKGSKGRPLNLRLSLRWARRRAELGVLSHSTWSAHSQLDSDPFASCEGRVRATPSHHAGACGDLDARADLKLG
jgi:hypothetical protein